MKKLFYIPAVLAFAVFASCGPSAAEKRAKHVADSTRAADSIAQIQKAEADKLAAEQAKQQAATDSVARVEREKFVADSIAAASKGGKKK